MYILDEPKIVYMAQPRTGSHAVQAFLRSLCELQGWRIRSSGGHHGTGSDNLIESLQDQGYRTFSAVRNHWDILTSFWYQQYNRDTLIHQSFETWLPHFLHKGNEWVKLGEPRLFWRYVPRSNIVIRYERLGEELHQIFSALADQLPELERVNHSSLTPIRYLLRDGTYQDSALPPRTHYSHYYTEKTRDMVQERFKEEIQRYGYVYKDDPCL